MPPVLPCPMYTQTKSEAERRAAEESQGKAEAKCKVLEGTADRLEGDLARLTAQVMVKLSLYYFLRLTSALHIVG